MKRLTRGILCLMLCAAMMTTASFAYETLEYGDAGEDVRALQIALTERGYSLTADGKYGPATRRAVRAYQSANQLTTDGKAGHQTLTKLYSGTSVGGTAAASGAESAASNDTAAQTGAVSSASGTLATVKGGALKLRPTASTKKTQILIIPDRSSLLVTKRGDTWSAVSYEGRNGYVMTKFLSISGEAAASSAEQTAQPTVAPALSAATGTPAVVKGGSLKLRPTASTKQKPILIIPDRAAVSVTSRGDAWSAVVYNGKNGYVMTKYLSFDVEAQAGEGSSADTGTQTSVAGVVPVLSAENGATLGKATLARTGVFYKSPGGAAYGTLNPGAAVNILATGSKYCTISYGGDIGYIPTECLTFSDELLQTFASVDFKPVASGTKAQVGVDRGLNATADSMSSYTIQVNAGATVTVLTHGVEWTYAEYNGKRGYIPTQYLSFGGVSSSYNVASGVKYDTVTVENGDATAYDAIGGTVVGTIKEGAKVSKVKIGTEWSTVIWNGSTVYVQSSHFDSQYAVYTYAYFEGEIVSGGAALYANWRAGKADNNRFDTLAGGTKVHVDAMYTSPDGTEFYGVISPKGSAFVLRDRVKVLSDEITETLEDRVKADSWIGASVKADTAVYQSASADSAQIGVIPAGTYGILCMNIGGQWTYILHGDGYGYVPTASLTYAESQALIESP